MSMAIGIIYNNDGMLRFVATVKSLTKSLVLNVSLWTVKYYLLVFTNICTFIVI